MVYSYSIDKDIIDNFDAEEFFEFLDKLDSFFNVIKKRSIWLECQDLPMYNDLSTEIGEFLELTKDHLSHERALEFYYSNIHDQYVVLDHKCACSDSSECDCDKLIGAMNATTPNLDYYITSNAKVSDPEIKLIHLNDYKSSTLYTDCNSTTSWEGGIPSDNTRNIDMIIKAWGKVFGLSREVTILDRNVFNGWDNPTANYQKGLNQFYEAIQRTNPNCLLRIITRKQASVDPIEQGNRYKRIQSFVDGLSGLKIEFCLTEYNIKMDHDRFIKFDDHIGAFLNRGLDTFVSSGQYDNYRVIYFSPSEVQRIMQRPSSNIIKTGDFKVIRNF